MGYPTDGKIGANSTSSDTEARFAVGTRVSANNGQIWLYISASSAIAANDCVAVSNAFAGAPITKALADLGYQPANAIYAIGSGEYGFVAIHGAGLTQKVLGSCAHSVSLYTSPVAGALDDNATTAQTRVWGAVGITSAGTTGTTNITANLIFPHTQLAPAVTA